MALAIILFSLIFIGISISINHDHTYSRLSKRTCKEKKDNQLTQAAKRVKLKAVKKEVPNLPKTSYTSFFKENSNYITKLASENMSTVHVEHLGDSFKLCVKYIIENPTNICIPETMYDFLKIFDENNVKTKANFVDAMAKLMNKDQFTDVMMTSFFNIDEFKMLNEFETYQITNCFVRRFLEQGLLKRAEIESEATKKLVKNDIRPYLLLTPSQTIAKEEKVVHHIGAYIARQLILIYGHSSSYFIRNTIKLKCTASEDFQKWTEELNRGGLIFLSSNGFAFAKEINDVSKVHFSRENLNDKERVKIVTNELRNNLNIKQLWPQSWGDSENQNAALNRAFQIYLNCLGKGCVNKAKTDVQIAKRLSLKTNSLRKQMKSQKPCNKCHGKPEVKENVPRVKKAPKGFLS